MQNELFEEKCVLLVTNKPNLPCALLKIKFSTFTIEGMTVKEFFSTKKITSSSLKKSELTYCLLVISWHIALCPTIFIS